MEANRIRLRLYSAIFTALLMLGSLGFMFSENLSLLDAIYFSIVTMATVGYGDIHPHSAVGKILALLLIIGGVGTFLGFVAIITDTFVKRREELIMQQKLNMITGLFFSEIGNGLLKHFAQLDPEVDRLHKILKISNEWAKADFIEAAKGLEHHSFVIDSHRGNLFELREYLHKQADLLLRLLENPIIHEQGKFSDLLRATFHLRDELLNREDLSELLSSDRKHLEGDIIRIYRLLIFEWLRYVRYLKKDYPYLFSLAVRVNPFDLEASAVVKGP